MQQSSRQPTASALSLNVHAFCIFINLYLLLFLFMERELASCHDAMLSRSRPTEASACASGFPVFLHKERI